MKKNYFLTLMFGFVFHVTMWGQYNVINSMLRGGSGSDFLYNITALPGNEILLVGRTSSSDGDLANNEGLYDMWLLHLDASLNVVLSTSLGGNSIDMGAKALYVPGTGYYVIGFTYSTGGGIVTNNYGSADAWVVHLDTQGNLVWQKAYGGSQYDEAMDAIIDSSGNLVLAGTSYSSDHDLTGNNGGADAWVVKIDPSNGQILWQTNFGGSSEDYLFSIVEDQANGQYIVGGFSRSSDQDLATAGNQGADDELLAAIDYSGNLNWVETFGGSASDILFDIYLDTNEIYLTGYTYSADGDISNNLGGSDFWVTKIDANTRNIIWEKSYGGSGDDYPSRIFLNSDGHLMLSGYTSSNDGDVSTNLGGSDMWVVETDTNGNLISEKTFGGTGSEMGGKLVELPNGHFVITGGSDSNDGDFNNMSLGGGDGVVLTFIKPTNSISRLNDNAWTVFPVPADSNIEISSNEAFSRIEIMDLTGKIIRTQQVEPTKNLNLDVSELQSGNYILKIQGNHFEAMKKFIVK